MQFLYRTTLRACKRESFAAKFCSINYKIRLFLERCTNQDDELRCRNWVNKLEAPYVCFSLLFLSALELGIKHKTKHQCRGCKGSKSLGVNFHNQETN